MKKINLLLLFCVFVFASCKKDFLEELPEGQIGVDKYFKSLEEFNQALNGAYVPLRYVADTAFYMDEMRSDNTHYDYDSKDRGGSGYEQLADFMDDAENAVTLQRYKANYIGIHRTNTILDRLEKITFEMSDADKNRIIGETKALRGHYYFDLVTHYGGVPLHIHEVTLVQQANLASSTKEEVYTQIIADLKDAYEKVDVPKFPQTGRVTKGMVAATLGKVYMSWGKPNEAIPYLEAVTKMGYDLLPNYADIFSPTNKNNIESIFEVQYKAGTDGQQSSFIYRFIPRTPDTKNILGVSFNNTIGGWNTPTQDLIDAYEDGDKRLDASIGVVEGTLNSSADFMPTKIVSILDYKTNDNVVAKYFTRKFFHLPYNMNRNTDDNWMLIRYADVLLLLAEAYNENGNSSAALPLLNKVRNRAGLAAIHDGAKENLKKAIAQERRVELAFENHRWLDLVRTGKAQEVMTAHGNQLKKIYGYLLANSYHVNENRLIYPIPFRELKLNTLLEQNPGY
ncbi:RagB/SusD family nutrient uptake outer membrane protein [Sphingobacterium sp. SRCM116780]|uniref:RagB/SusD family nutrient uptake outer membrane protein n=1 Tax=Sphingobacterium sp. SRCM116780 TaxID=2907623 RepID=UPI001F19231D|nr:RagB/SusD family nutrient uptake outer membrane protein [Sphingobacterium sp. SRCM116780]UIR56229.1 RagB/SusD family nutrient uptake outer membrane protein [Sphingobacterium sp. SRCM116780]